MKKDKKSIILTISSIIIMYFLLFVVIDKVSIINYSHDLFLLATIGILFVSSHFIFNIKKMYEFIYKYRYLIGLITIIFITVMGYNGSSVSFWNRIIQPNHNIDVVVGFPRGIRSDEWMVSTVTSMSQIYNNFSCTNSTIMAQNSLVTLFPSLPCLGVSSLANIFNLTYLIMPFENAFAFSWYIKIIATFFVIFELLMVITKKNKLYSCLGGMLITFSACNMWWSGITMLIFGVLAVLIFYYFLNTNSKLKKLCLSILFGICGLNYIMTVYPAWQVPFGYVFLGFIIWIIVENKDKLKVKDLIYLIPVLLIIIPIVYIILTKNYEIFNLMNNTVYPGARSVNGGNSGNLFYNYLGGLFYPIISYQNPSEMSNFFSFYPIPIVLSIYYMIKSKKIDLFLLIFTTIGILLSIWNYISVPDILLKISLLSFSIPERTYIVVGFICILLLIRFLYLETNNKIDKKSIVIKTILAISFSIITVLICNNCLNGYLNWWMIILSTCILAFLTYLLLVNSKKTNKIFAYSLIFLSLYIGGTVHPINKGLSVITDKPFSKEIAELVENNKDSIWISSNAHFSISNYMVANGAKTINSVNYYPNFKTMQKLDKNNKYEDIYNRYAHISIKLSNLETTFELIANDHFMINLNVDDLKTLDVDYIVSEEDILKYQNDNVKLNLEYNEDGIYIYRVEVK